MSHDRGADVYLENRTFDEIAVGDFSILHRVLTREDIKLFAIMSGDVNPAVVDPEFAESGMFREVVAHGMWSAALISTMLGTEFPGPGTILIDQSLHFDRPVTIGDSIAVKVTVKEKYDHNKHMTLDCVCTNQEGLQVVHGHLEVLAPTEKIRRKAMNLPQITISDKEARYQHLLGMAAGLEPIDVAVVHPCDAESLRGPVMAA
ncbi:MAG TPA: MaoC/PaaZ C-terminal domain-containing protein, partial [Rhodocyclaceae bacterium]